MAEIPLFEVVEQRFCAWQALQVTDNKYYGLRLIISLGCWFTFTRLRNNLSISYYKH
jgi:hypothetical protein